MTNYTNYFLKLHKLIVMLLETSASSKCDHPQAHQLQLSILKEIEHFGCWTVSKRRNWKWDIGQEKILMRWVVEFSLEHNMFGLQVVWIVVSHGRPYLKSHWCTGLSTIPEKKYWQYQYLLIKVLAIPILFV